MKSKLVEMIPIEIESYISMGGTNFRECKCLIQMNNMLESKSNSQCLKMWVKMSVRL